MLSGLRDLLVRSLVLRWVIYITSAAGLGIGLLLAISYSEMSYQIDAQGAAVRQLARQRAAERIDAEIELAAHRLRGLFDGYEQAMLSIAGLRSTQAAIAGGNDVTIAEEVGRRLVGIGMSGAVVIDRHRNVIGADRAGAELPAANSALRIHDIYPVLGDLLEENSRSRPRTHRITGPLDASFSAVLQASFRNDYGIILVLNDVSNGSTEQGGINRDLPVSRGRRPNISAT